MPFSPLISKIRCHNPNKKGSKNANRNNIKYIATRSGVDISNLKDAENINDLLRENKEWVNNSMNEDKLSSVADNDTYMKYIAERPRSHGLFGNIDTTDLDKVGKDIYDLTKKGRNIYRGVISLSQKDAEMLGFTNKDAWNTYLRSVMPDIAKELGISTVDFSWVAAYHAEKSHPHIHFQLWDNRDVIKSSYIHPSRQSNIRNMLSKEMFNDDYEKFVRDITTPEHNLLNSEKDQARDELTSFLKDVFINFTEHVPGIEPGTLPDRIENTEIETLANQLYQLIEHENFPKTGRLNYKFMPLEIKTELNKICDTLLERSDYKKSFENYIDVQGQISKLNGKTSYEISKSKKEAEKDIYGRMGNIVLKSAKTLLERKESLITLTSQNDITNINDLFHDTPNSYDYDFVSKENTDMGYKYKDEMNTDTDFYHTALFQDDVRKEPFPNEESNLNELNSNNDMIDRNFDENINEFSKSFWTKTLKEAMKAFYDDRDYQTALVLFNKEFMRGNPIALEKLGLMYSKGIGVDINAKLAYSYYEKALNGYNKLLLESKNEKMINYIYYRLGKLYENGLGTEIDYEKAKYYYSKAINADNKYAMYSLGRIYMDGKGIKEHENIEEYKQNSFELIKESADLEFAYAAYQTGTFYYQGIFTEQNNKIAHEYYKQAFDGFRNMLKSYEDDNVLYRLGQMTFNGLGVEKNTEKAIDYLKKSMKLKNENASLLLSRIYIELKDDEKLNEAIQILTNLSNNGNNRASYSLGRIYATEENSNYNLEKAIQYYELANQEDNKHAQYGLGKIYADKDSLFFDEEKAVHYFKLSADHGNSYAQYSLGKIYSDSDSKLFDMKIALDYLEQSAKTGNEHAAFSLGHFYLEKEAEYFDMDKAIIYLEQASNCDHLYAVLKLAQIYEDETNQAYFNLEHSKTYYEKAFHLLEKNISQRTDYNNYTMIARLYLDGKGVAQNVKKGIDYLKEASDHNDANAQYRLGRMYLWGEQVKKDEEKGLEYLTKASNNGNPYAKESIQFYYDFKKRQSKIMAYDIFKFVHTMFESLNNDQMSTYNTFKRFRNRGKQAQKEEAMRLRIKGSSYDNENY